MIPLIIRDRMDPHIKSKDIYGQPEKNILFFN